MTLEELEREAQELRARAAADTAFLRCAIFTLSTAQLRGAKLTLETLTEDMTVKFLFMESASDEANRAFEEKKNFWLDALQVEITAREKVSRL